MLRGVYPELAEGLSMTNKKHATKKLRVQELGVLLFIGLSPV
jgi:hypothetical protein